MSTTVEVVPLPEGQVREAVDVLSRAFLDDVGFRYVFPDPAARREKLPVFMDAACRLSHHFGHAYTTVGRVEGAVLWMPPGEAEPTPAYLAAPGFAHLADVWGEEAMGRFSAIATHLEELHHRDMPAAHWYLFVIGVDPSRQGQGLGGQLVQPILRRADAEGLSCYLETPKARNVPFYQRHGFEVVVETDVPGGGPRFWTMRRYLRMVA